MADLKSETIKSETITGGRPGSGAHRVVALCGPYLSGKTSLLESILYASGAIGRRGSTRAGTSIGDAAALHAGEEMIRWRALQLVEVVGVPQSNLRFGRVEPDLVHPSIGARVWLTGVPEAVMEDEDRTRRAHDLLLADDVLVSVQARRTDSGQVAAGHEAGPTFAWGDVIAEPEHLDIEALIERVDIGIDMQRLVERAAGRDVVDPVVIELRQTANERLDNPADLWQAEVLTDHRWLEVALVERRPRARWPHRIEIFRRQQPASVQCLEFSDCPPVDVGRDDRVEPQKPVRHKFSHLPSREAMIKACHWESLADRESGCRTLVTPG